MTKLQKILDEVRKEMREAMMFAVMNGDDRCRYEMQVGDAYIDIESHEVRMISGLTVSDHDVYVSHEDTQHRSPRLEAAIREMLPEWYEIREEVMQAA